MRIKDNIFFGVVIAGKTTNEVFEQWELESKHRPRFGRYWWFWMPSISNNGGGFRKNKTTDISFRWLCVSVYLTVYAWDKSA